MHKTLIVVYPETTKPVGKVGVQLEIDDDVYYNGTLHYVYDLVKDLDNDIAVAYIKPEAPPEQVDGLGGEDGIQPLSPLAEFASPSHQFPQTSRRQTTNAERYYSPLNRGDRSTRPIVDRYSERLERSARRSGRTY